MARFAWGIDIGDGTLKALRLKASGRSLKVVQVVEIPYHDPFLKKKSPPACLDRRAIAALVQLGSTIKVHEKDRVVVGFPSFHAFDGMVEIPRVEEDRLEEMIRYEITSKVDVPLEALKTTYIHHRLKSSDMEHFQVYAVRQDEFNAFIYYLEEARIPYDRIVSSVAALVDLTRLTQLPGNYLILSPGFNATSLVVLKESDFWTRTVPVGIPVAPETSIEVARDKVLDLCDQLSMAATNMVKGIFPDGDFELSKVLVSGEGGRVPSFVNALDTAFTAPVEVLRPPTSLIIGTEVGNQASEEAVQTMGKALGLAKCALEETPSMCVLSGPGTGRTTIKHLPVLVLCCVLVLVLVLGMSALEWNRSRRLAGLERDLERLKPAHGMEDLEGQQARIERLNRDIADLTETYRARGELLLAGKLFSRLERPSMRGTYGDFNMLHLEMYFEGKHRIKASVATRLESGEAVKEELAALFRTLSPSPAISGPFAAEEERPPEGMAPRVRYDAEGDLPQ